MNLLSSLLPGIRDLRTPLAVGALWLGFAYLAVAPFWNTWIAESAELSSIYSFVAKVPDLYFLGGLAFLAYLVGVVLVAFSELITSWLTTVVGLLSKAVVRRLGYGRLARLCRRFLSQTRDVPAVRGPVGDAISAAYAKAGAPATAHFAFPLDLILDRFDATALQLWQKSPNQYQEYDRLRAESAFRAGVTLPLIAISIVLAIRISWVTIPVAVIGAAVLLVQARKLEHRRDVLMANALHQGLVEDPLLKAVAGEIPALETPKSASSPAWVAVTAVALSKWGEFDGMEEAIEATVREVFETMEMMDVNEAEWATTAEGLAKEVDQVFVDGDEKGLQTHFRMKLDDALASREQARLRRESLGV
jgi:hypothetical protein